MAEQDAGKEKGGFLSKIIKGGSAPDLEAVLAEGKVTRLSEMPVPRVPKGGPPAAASVPQAPQPAPAPENSEEAPVTIDQQFEYVHAGLSQIFDLVVSLHEKESSHERAFDAVYKELNDYKNDFFYERLKPIVRPLLFLMDSLEQFREELSAGSTTDPQLVRENVQHFMDQLTDVLHICEMQPLDKPSGAFDPKVQKAVDVVAVSPAQDNKIQRVVRGGWTLNGDLLRPAEVVVGKAR